MTPLLLRASRRYLTRHPWQIGLAILGVALGVAVVVAVDLANGSALRKAVYEANDGPAILANVERFFEELLEKQELALSS